MFLIKKTRKQTYQYYSGTDTYGGVMWGTKNVAKRYSKADAEGLVERLNSIPRVKVVLEEAD